MTTDEPRKIVVCSYSDFSAIKRGIAEMKLGDVLVRPNKYIEDGQAFVMDNPWSKKIL